jgi:hypothetical protein
MNADRAWVELITDADEDWALALRVTGDTESGPRECITVRLTDEQLRHLRIGLDMVTEGMEERR